MCFWLIFLMLLKLLWHQLIFPENCRNILDEFRPISFLVPAFDLKTAEGDSHFLLNCPAFFQFDSFCKIQLALTLVIIIPVQLYRVVQNWRHTFSRVKGTHSSRNILKKESFQIFFNYSLSMFVRNTGDSKYRVY